MIRRRVFHVETTRGRRFALLTLPAADTPVGGMLFVHPFAEEMNKSRRMVALAAAAFASVGWAVLQVDLTGCGDSDGDFGDADWQSWLDDVSAGWSTLGEVSPGPNAIWTLRAGCLVAADWLAQRNERPPLLMWQPVQSGRVHLTQFLRLKAASQMVHGGEGVKVSALLDALAAGEHVEVAGYSISPGLAAGLGAAALRLPKDYPSAVTMLEIVSAEGSGPSAAIAGLADAWRGEGVAASAAACVGPPFWQTQEIETAPALIDASISALDGFRR